MNPPPVSSAASAPSAGASTPQTPSVAPRGPAKRPEPPTEPEMASKRREEDSGFVTLPIRCVHGAGTTSAAATSESKNQEHMSLFIQEDANSPAPPAAPRRLLVAGDFVQKACDAALAYLGAECQDGVLGLTIVEAIRKFKQLEPEDSVDTDPEIDFEEHLDALLCEVGKLTATNESARLARLARNNVKPLTASAQPKPDDFSADVQLIRLLAIIVPLLDMIIQTMRRPRRRPFSIDLTSPRFSVEESGILHLVAEPRPIHALEDLFEIPLAHASLPGGFGWGFLPVERIPSSSGSFGTARGAQALYDEAVVHLYVTPDSLFFGIVLPLDSQLPPVKRAAYRATDLIPYAYILSPLIPVSAPQLPLILWLASASPLVLVAALADHLRRDPTLDGFRAKLRAEGFEIRSGPEIRAKQVWPDEVPPPDGGDEGAGASSGGSQGAKKSPTRHEKRQTCSSLCFEVVALDGSGAIWNRRVARRISHLAVEKHADFDMAYAARNYPSFFTSRPVDSAQLGNCAPTGAPPPSLQLYLSPRLGDDLERAVILGKIDSSTVVVKYGEPEPIAQEALFLERAGSIVAPRLYGVFGHSDDDDGQWCIVQSYEGERLRAWRELTVEQKNDLYARVVEMHQNGVEHGDLAKRNVVVQEGRVKVIDFGEAHMHECEGEDICGELMELKELLEMDG